MSRLRSGHSLHRRRFGPSQPSLRKASLQDVHRRVRVPIRLKSARRARVFTNPDVFRRLYTTPNALFGSTSRFDLHDVTTVQVAFVFEEGDELSPRRILLIPSVPVALKHSCYVEVFHEHGVVLLDEPRREFVLIVQHLPLDTTFEFGNFSALFLPVVRPVFFPREFALLPPKTLVVVFEVEPIHGLPIAGVDIVEDPEVNSDAVTRVQLVHVRFLGRVFVVGL